MTEEIRNSISLTASEKYNILKKRDAVIRRGKLTLNFNCDLTFKFFNYPFLNNFSSKFAHETANGAVRSSDALWYMPRYVPRNGAVCEGRPSAFKSVRNHPWLRRST